MARSTGLALSWFRAALLCTAAASLLGTTSASARVGVTSATTGEPLGKPPSEAERILRIGIDVQANEIITTGANDRAHLVFLDGTSLTVGPDARLTIDKFVYDPSTKTGELAVNASKGVLRLVGGRISKTKPITIRTPSSTIGIRGGITIVNVQPNQTTSTFIFGNNMTVSGQGQTQNVTRPGSQVTTNQGSPPGPPTLVGQGGLSNQISQLEGRGGGNQGGGNQGSGGSAPGAAGGNTGGGRNIASIAERGASNFGQQNSGQGPNVGGPPGRNIGTGNNPNNPGQDPRNGNNNGIQNAVSGAGNQGQSNNGNTSSSSNTTTKIIITKGRYLADPIYSNFNNSDLSVTTNTTNNKAIAQVSGDNLSTTTTTTTSHNGSTSTSTSSTLQVSVPGLATVSLPWQQDTLSNGFSISGSDLKSIASSLGVNLSNGTGYVSSKGQFFAYVFTTTGSSNNKVGIFGGTPTNTSGTTDFPTSGIGTFVVGNLGNPTHLPFANDTVGGNSDLNNAKIVSKLYAAYSSTLSGTVGSQPPDARATALQATISISGQGNQQKSYMGVFIGTFLRDITTTGGTITTDNGMYMAGHFASTYRTSATSDIGREVSAESTPSNGTGNGNAIYGTGTADATHDGAASGIILTPDKMTTTFTVDGSNNITNITATRTSQASFDQPYNNLSGSDYFSVVAAYKTATPSTVGQTRTTQTLNGFFGGLVDQLNSGGHFSTRAVTNSDPSNLSLSTNATTNRASATLTASAWDGSTSATFKLGGTTGSNQATSAFIDDNIYALRDRTSDIGNTTTVGGSSTGVTSNTQIISYNSAAVDSLFMQSGVNNGQSYKCTCSFLTWGWWGGDIKYDSTSGYNTNGRDRLNFATYVAGTLATTAQLPNTGSATFTGHVVGNVLDNNKAYIATGMYSNSWNWGSSSGSVTISNFDGATYTGTTNLNSGTVQFSGSLSGPSSRTGSINGAFFQSGGQVAGQAGSFSVSGGTYKAAGTFAAQK